MATLKAPLGPDRSVYLLGPSYLCLLKLGGISCLRSFTTSVAFLGSNPRTGTLPLFFIASHSFLLSSFPRTAALAAAAAGSNRAWYRAENYPLLSFGSVRDFFFRRQLTCNWLRLGGQITALLTDGLQGQSALRYAPRTCFRTSTAIMVHTLIATKIIPSRLRRSGPALGPTPVTESPPLLRNAHIVSEVPKWVLPVQNQSTRKATRAL